MFGGTRVLPISTGKRFQCKVVGTDQSNTANNEPVGEHDWPIAPKSALDGRNPITNVRF